MKRDRKLFNAVMKRKTAYLGHNMRKQTVDNRGQEMNREKEDVFWLWNIIQ